MPTYFLPELKKDFQDPESAGQWVQSGRLDAMAGALEISSKQVEIDALKSLPDPWARPLLFAQALTSETHIAKDSAREKWRGLLALLGLQRFYAQAYAIDVLITDLDDTSQGNPLFRDVLKILAPTDALDPSLSWTRTGVITIQSIGQDTFDTGSHQAVGLMVPNCLVAPSRGVGQMKMADVPWLRDGLTDPTLSAELPAQQWAALYDYLGRLFQHLNKPQISQRGAALRAELQSFAQACQAKIEEAGGTAYTPDYEGATRGLPDPFYAPIMDAPKKPEVAYDLPSECLLQMRRSDSVSPDLAGVAGFVLHDPAMAEQTFGRSAMNVRFWKGNMLGRLTERGTLNTVEQDVRRDGYLIVTPDDLLTAKLTRLVNNGRVTMHSPDWENFLLPISPLVLFLMSREDIANKLTISDRGDRYEVRLELAITPEAAGARPINHTLIKEYSKASDVIEEAAGDDIVLWPDVGSAKWPWNFLRMSHSPGLQLAPRFAASLASLSETVKKRARQNAEEAIDILRAIGSNADTLFERQDPFFSGNSGELKGTDNKLIAHRFRFADNADLIGEQHLIAHGGEALFFAADPEETGDTIPSGCMLLPERRSEQRPGKVEIAVDFGTTNTVVYMKSGSKAERMEFEARVARPFTVRSATDDDFALACVEFMPAARVTAPFPTVMFLRTFDLNGENPGQAQANSSYHGVSRNIFFMPDVADKFSKAIEYEQKSNLVFNLKWASEHAMRAKVQSFLRQIILMSAVEVMAAGNVLDDIEWHISYPQAWSKPQATNFQGLVKMAWREIFEPVLGKAASADKQITFETEGAAALRYFTEGPGMEGEAGSLMLMFDIGGGSTEIAVFKDDRTVWRSSFKLAGGDFFTGFMTSNMKIFDYIKDSESGASSFNEAIEKHTDGTPDRNFVELYISQQSFDDSFGQSYTMFSDEAEGRALRDCAMTALGGMFYYTGLVLKKCIEEGVFSESEVEDLTIAFAGRGSTFYRYLGDASDAETELGSLARIITDVALAKDGEPGASDEDDDDDYWDDEDENVYVNALFSPAPKHEVAFGMLCGEQQRRRKARIESTPLGETIKIRANREETELASGEGVEAIPAGASLVELGTSEFDNFIKVFGERTGVQFDLTAKGGKAKREIENTTRRQFNKAMGALEKKEKDNPMSETLDIEPPFITRLRGLVQILASKMADRDTKLSVHHRDSSW